MPLWVETKLYSELFLHEALQNSEIGVDTTPVTTTPNTRHSAHDGYTHIENIDEMAKKIILQDRKNTCIEGVYMSTLCIQNIVWVLSHLNHILTV